MSHAILYSFRRCPYAMRSRLAIAISGVKVELREVVLRDKPAALLQASPKGTVPVLVTVNRQVIAESLDIMLWALQQNDPDNWLLHPTNKDDSTSRALITHNDSDFKYWLDRYKYADRFPEQTQLYYRQQAEKTLASLETLLSSQAYLLGEITSVTDMAILPFIRQFAFVDKTWFDNSSYTYLKSWLDQFITSPLFQSIMIKQPQWQPEDNKSVFA
jgi:glutathione S-transferase